MDDDEAHADWTTVMLIALIGALGGAILYTILR